MSASANPRKTLQAASPPLPLYVRAIQARLRSQLRDHPCTIEKVDHPELGFSEVFFCAEDTPDLLVRVAAVFASQSINILGAQIHPQSDGTVLDTYQVNHRGRELSDAGLWTAVTVQIRQVLTGQVAFPALIEMAAQKARNRRSVPLGGEPLPTRVFIENEASPRHTVVEVYTRDELGLLCRIFNAFALRRVRVADAKVVTVAGRVADLFFVTDRSGRKIRGGPPLRSLRAGILEALAG